MRQKNKFIGVVEELNLDEEEEKVIMEILKKSRKMGKINEFSVIHSLLKISLDEIVAKGFDKFQEMAMAQAPPLAKEYKDAERILLPKDYISLSSSLDKILSSRSSKRDYSGEILTLQELSTLLYFSYGVRRYIQAYNSDKFPLRLAPSSGGLQGVELYLVINRVEGLKRGIYHYYPFDHSLELINEGNFRRKMVNLCVKQDFIDNANIIIILTGVMERLFWKYNIRAYRYIHMDAGFLGENIYLVGTALKLGICAIAGFFDDELNELLDIDGKNEFVVLLISIGKLVPTN